MAAAHPLLFAISTIALGCGALDEFEETITDEATIPGGHFPMAPFSLEYDGDFSNLNLSQSRSFADNGVTPSDVDAISVKSVVLEGTNPRKDKLRPIIESIEVLIEATGQASRRIAYLDDIPEGARAELNVESGADLKAYATSPPMRVSVEVKLKQRPALAMTLRTTIVLLIDVNLAGV